MKVLFVEYFGRGGIAHYTHCLAQAVAGLGLTTILCTGQPYELKQMKLAYQFREVFSIYGFQEQARNRRRPKLAKGMGFLQGCWHLRDVVVETAPSVVHIQSSSLLPAVELELVVWLGKRVPLVYTIHNLLPHEARLHHRLMYRCIYRRPRALIVHGEAIKVDLQRYFAPLPPVHVVPHGEYSFLSFPQDAPSQSAARQRLGVPLQVPLILFFGAIRAYKGLDTLLEALPEVLAAVPEAQVWIVGKPAGDFGPYQSQISLLGLDNHVKTVLEYVPQEHIPYYFAAADIIAAPYKETYQSGVVQLAYAAARPVVATLTGALPEVVEDGCSGLLVPPRNPHALAQALVRLLSEPQAARSMGGYGQHLATTRFSWQAIAAQTIAIYEEAIG